MEEQKSNETNDKNQKTGTFKTKFFDFLDKSVNVSKNGLKTAGQKISDFGDKSVQKIELSQQKSKLETLYKAFGKESYAYLSASKNSILTSQTQEIKDLYNQIKTLQKDISEREKKLAQAEEKSSKSQKTENSSKNDSDEKKSSTNDATSKTQEKPKSAKSSEIKKSVTKTKTSAKKSSTTKSSKS